MSGTAKPLPHFYRDYNFHTIETGRQLREKAEIALELLSKIG